MDSSVFKALLHRSSSAHKYNFGHVLVVGGSPGMVGAPFMAAKAAMRAGAGLATIASTADVADKLEERVEEIMTLRLPDDPLQAGTKLQQFVKDRKVTVAVIGPGMKGEALARTVLAKMAVPVIVDGGAIPVISDKQQGNVIVTPHDGEFKKLTGQQPPKSVDERKQTAAQFAQSNNIILVLKGNPTIVAQPDGKMYVNTTGGPQLATAGTGDVLTGVIAALVGQGLEPGKAAEAGVYLHGLAGDLAGHEKTQAGLIATDVIEKLPQAFKKASA